MRIRWNYFTKLLLMNSLIIVIPIGIMGLLSYEKTTNLVKEKVNNSHLQMVQQTAAQMDNLLRAADFATTQFALSQLAVSAVDLDNGVNRFVEVRNIVNEMTRLESYELKIRDTYYVNFDKKWVIWNGGISPIEDITDRKRLETLFSYNKSSYWTTELEASGKSSPYLELVKKIPLLPNAVPSAMFVSRIPISEYMYLLKGQKNEFEFYLFDSENRLLPSGTEQIPPEHASGFQNVPQMRGEYGEVTSIDGKYVYTYRKLAQIDWKIVMVTPIEDIVRGTSVISRITLLTCFGVFLFTLIVTILGTRRMYSPIRRLYRIVERHFSMNTHRKDEFKFIGDQIFHLLDSQSSMVDTLNKQTGQLKDHFIIKLLQDEWSRQEIAEKMEQFGFSGWEQMMVLAVQLDSLEGTKFESKDRELLLYAIHNMLSELIMEDRRLGPVLYNRSVAVIIGEGESDSAGDLSIEAVQIANRIRDAVKHYLHLDVSVGISRPVCELKHAARAYQESMEALEYRIRYNKGVVLRIDELVPELNRKFYFPKSVEFELFDAIRQNEADRAKVLLTELVQNVTSEQLGSYRDYQTFFLRLVLDLLDLAHNQGVNPEKWQEKMSLLHRFFEYKSAMEIEQWIWKEVVTPLISEIESNRMRQYVDISGTMKQIIHERYQTDITLETCASIMNFNPDYLRQVFRKQTGINFSEYLSSYRLKMAKQMLVETELTIKDIAEKLCYNNPQNFIRYFRKMEGVTPGQYRERKSLS